MSTNRHINKICVLLISLAFVLTVILMVWKTIAPSKASNHQIMGYENHLFDNSSVHTINIVMDDWDSFIAQCENEEYSLCTAIIDGEKYTNIGIRAKGNTSLSSVRSMGSERYSFKLEFDQYDNGQSYYGLDKLCLNNLIQDNTMMKDYIVYRMMSEFGVDSPLCSYVYITVNDEDWGLYLAVEGVEESFLSRNYGSVNGDLYKPDSMSFGGGRGNGKSFNMEDFSKNPNSAEDTFNPENKPNFDMNNFDGEFNPGDIPNFDMGNFKPSGNGDRRDFKPSGDTQRGFSPMDGMGSSDVKLQYIDDNPDSYSNIFNSAKTNPSKADKARLIASLKDLNDYNNLENILNIEEVLRYFVVHNFVCNGDSYTGNMIHNYYLYEENGKFSMIPWDYNLAFGTFMGNNALDSVNESIDNPISGGNVDDRPMLGWIFSDEKYTEMYHELFNQFIDIYFTDNKLTDMITDTANMIRPYVDKDPTRFCSTEDFDKGVSALTQYVQLRSEAVQKQLSGDSTLVDTNSLSLSDMGTMNNGFGGSGLSHVFKK